MPSPLSGPGVGLNINQFLYPTELANAPYDIGTNRVALAPGDTLPIPAGDFYVYPGLYCVLQFNDPNTGLWTMAESASDQGGTFFVKSDGFNWRVANLTGCPITAVVTGQGSGYVQSSTTVTPNVGNSTWTPIIGGQLALNSITNAGAGYGVAPLVLLPAPPQGGVPATAYAVITNGTVSGVTLNNAGAGYTGATVSAVVLPSPTDPNIGGTITQASVNFTTTASAGKLTAVLCTNPGAPLATVSALTLTVAGVGTGATVSGVVMQTVTGASVTAGGAGYAGQPIASTYGGQPPAGAALDPIIEMNNWRVRNARIGFAVGAGAITSVATLYDGGLFLGTPSATVSNAGVTTTAATISLIVGSVADWVTIQNAP